MKAGLVTSFFNIKYIYRISIERKKKKEEKNSSSSFLK